MLSEGGKRPPGASGKKNDKVQDTVIDDFDRLSLEPDPPSQLQLLKKKKSRKSSSSSISVGSSISKSSSTASPAKATISNGARKMAQNYIPPKELSKDFIYLDGEKDELEAFAALGRKGLKPKKSKFHFRLEPIDFTMYDEAEKSLHMKGKELQAVNKSVDIISRDLEELFEMQRIENEAAAKIQRAFRWSLLIVKIRRVLLSQRMAAKIQRIFRGFITRKWVAAWYSYRDLVASNIQAHVRKFLSNLRWNEQRWYEYDMAIEIQRIIRGKIARTRYKEVLMNLCALKIQRLYRGAVVRSKTDKMWLDAVATRIQSAIRQKLARMTVEKMRMGLHAAARMIQKTFRCFVAKKTFASMIFKREDTYLRSQIAKLSAEEEFAEEKLNKLLLRMEHQRWQQRTDDVTAKYTNLFEKINYKESMLVEMSRQREAVSPRSTLQGWVNSLNDDIANTRQEVTDLKYDCLFKKLPAALDGQDLMKAKIGERDRLIEERRCCAAWKDDEFSEERQRNYHREVLRKERQSKLDIAEEKRKWRVNFFNPMGKPDLLRKADEPWDEKAFAGPERYGYSAAHAIDLLAQLRGIEKPKTKADEFNTAAKVNAATDKMVLQTYFDQINAYEQLLLPVSSIMKKMTAPPDEGVPGRVQPSVAPLEISGYGEGGREFSKALADVERWDSNPTYYRPEDPKYHYHPAQKFISRKRKTKSKLNTILEASKLPMVQVEKQLTFKEYSEQKAKAQPEKVDTRSEDFWKPRTPLAPRENYSAYDVEEDLRRKEEERKRIAEENRNKRLRFAKQRRQERKEVSSKIPWNLLDELVGEKQKLENERAFFEFRFHQTEEDTNPQPRKKGDGKAGKPSKALDILNNHIDMISKRA